MARSRTQDSGRSGHATGGRGTGVAAAGACDRVSTCGSRAANNCTTTRIHCFVFGNDKCQESTFSFLFFRTSVNRSPNKMFGHLHLRKTHRGFAFGRGAARRRPKLNQIRDARDFPRYQLPYNILYLCDEITSDVCARSREITGSVFVALAARPLQPDAVAVARRGRGLAREPGPDGFIHLS